MGFFIPMGFNVNRALPLAAASLSQRASFNRPLPSVERDRFESEATSLLGWSVSALAHGFMLALVVVLNFHVGQAPVIQQKELFRWEVSLMAAPKVESIVAEGVSQQAATAANESDLQPAVDARPIEPLSQSADRPEEPLRSDAVVGEVATQSNPRHASPMSGHSILSADDAANVASPTVVSPAVSPLPPPEIENPHESSSLQVSTQPENPAVLQRPQAVSRSVMTRAALPDYTWLMDTLRTKLEQVKIYPSSARTSHAQGRVVVRVSILSNGRILDSEVEESSGHPILDQAALDALQAASPLALAHSLEGESVVMLVPLNYQLE